MANHKKKKFSVAKTLKKLKKSAKSKIEKILQKVLFSAFLFSSHPVTFDVTLISVVKIYSTEWTIVKAPQPQSSNCKTDTAVP